MTATPTRSADASPGFMAFVGHILTRHGCSVDDWSRGATTRAAQGARRDIVTMLGSMKWRVERIARAVGLSKGSVRRQLNAARHARERAARVQLPVVEGPTMVGKRGERRDCVLEAQCLKALLDRSNKVNPPNFASCPKGCTYFEAPNADLRRYDASRRPGGAPSVF